MVASTLIIIVASNFSLVQMCCCLAVGVVVAQDYQDYNVRPAPARLHTGGQTETKPTPIPILKQINR